MSSDAKGIVINLKCDKFDAKPKFYELDITFSGTAIVFIHQHVHF